MPDKVFTFTFVLFTMMPDTVLQTVAEPAVHTLSFSCKLSFTAYLEAKHLATCKRFGHDPSVAKGLPTAKLLEKYLRPLVWPYKSICIFTFKNVHLR
jgi:hypothetical protein